MINKVSEVISWPKKIRKNSLKEKNIFPWFLTCSAGMKRGGGVAAK
jgi:hypothetical protein